MDINTSVTALKGVGPTISAALKRLKIETIGDLLQHFPRRWDDFSRVQKINQIVPGKIAVFATVEKVAIRNSNRNRRLKIIEAILSDGTGTLKAVWFNQPYLVQTLREGQSYLFAGNFEFKNNYLSLNSPTFELGNEANHKGAIYPIYPETAGLSSKVIQKLIAQIIQLVSELNDALPYSVEKSQNLITYSQSVKNLHQPTSMSEIDAAKDRLGFAELFELILTGLVIKHDIKTEPAVEIPFNLSVIESVLNQLDFELTDAQRKAAWAILQDLEKSTPMNRLLEGDVGSGKTLVALLALVTAAKANFQTALMVPTEILARQHAATIAKLIKPLKLRSHLLISALSAKEKKIIQQSITSHKTDIIIGTHALLSEGVEFHNLGLVIIDEQHRFGVGQRRNLKTKAKYSPHVLTMTATPIPRSLALVVYGDLDISVIDKLPPGRIPVETKVVKELDRTSVYSFVDQLLSQGQQAFIVCPNIEVNDFSSQKSVKAEFKRLQKTVFSHRKIAMLHGKMKATQKAQIMADFRDKKYNILLATTVIEVGVDVPNATTLIVENAERFGLAALHQLRGRVGRAKLKSYCYLFSDSQSPSSYKRLKAMERTTDGFRLAQIDLETRGPGEIYGTSQSGILDLRFANLFNTKLISEAKQEASAFLNSSDMVKYPKIVERINQLKKLTTLE